MRLVVLVPLISSVHAVEEAGLAGAVLVVPRVDLLIQVNLPPKRNLVIRHALSCLLLKHRILRRTPPRSVLRSSALELVTLLAENKLTLLLNRLCVRLCILCVAALVRLVEYRTKPSLLVTVLILLPLGQRLVPLAPPPLHLGLLFGSRGVIRHRCLSKVALKPRQLSPQDPRVYVLELCLCQSCLELRENLLAELWIEHVVPHAVFDLLLLLLELTPTLVHKSASNLLLDGCCRVHVTSPLPLAPDLCAVDLILAHVRHRLPELGVLVVEGAVLLNVLLKLLQSSKSEIAEQCVWLRKLHIAVIVHQVLGKDVDGFGPPLRRADLGPEAGLLEVELVRLALPLAVLCLLALPGHARLLLLHPRLLLLSLIAPPFHFFHLLLDLGLALCLCPPLLLLALLPLPSPLLHPPVLLSPHKALGEV
mmetsp:Transcript_25896/g.62454  ORF Transcript_25896/g.62454 Transcript_25896/m.62454 type:complete len:422 (-) Transcript_25896:218-1483(-)